jgi:NADH:ubiquinone oxidoreductase subunit H
MMFLLLENITAFLLIIVPLLISVAYLTLAERKVMGFIQQRKGPSFVGFWGLLQPLADGLKLLIKETVIPTNANTFSFVFSPILTLFLSLFG